MLHERWGSLLMDTGIPDFRAARPALESHRYCQGGKNVPDWGTWATTFHPHGKMRPPHGTGWSSILLATYTFGTAQHRVLVSVPSVREVRALSRQEEHATGPDSRIQEGQHLMYFMPPMVIRVRK